MAKYSIILPVRNGGSYVKECVNSILSQTLQDFTLQILDNSSSDGTLQWLQSLNDARIELYPEQRALTIEENWSRITTIPKNEFITVIGYDDLFHANYLQEMDKLINKHPSASLYQAHFKYINSRGEFKRHCQPMDEVQYAHEFIAQQFMRTFDSMGTGYMMRSKDYDDLGGIATYPNLIFGDYELWVKLIRKSYKATTVHECFSYREHNSTSRTTGAIKYQQAFERYVMFMYASKNEDVLIKEVVERYGHNYLMYFCESLSHRLLKTPVKDRPIKVKEYIDQCIGYAQKLLPGQPFDPRKVFRIKLAEELDNTAIGRGIFKMYKSASF